MLEKKALSTSWTKYYCQYRKDDKLLTNGGRVLGATAVAGTLADAIKEAYAMVEEIHFDNAYYRHDIGAKALKAGRN